MRFRVLPNFTKAANSCRTPAFFFPRILAPDKGVKNDQAKVERYTNFTSPYGGSSFSLGHYCEAYIDWGDTESDPLFLFGMLGAGLYLITLSRAAPFNPLLALGLGVHETLGNVSVRHGHSLRTSVWGAICHLILFFPFYGGE